MGWDAPWHWVVLAILVIALFGYKKMPDAARAMGRSLRIFKTEIKGMTEDDRAREVHDASPPEKPVSPAPIDPAAAGTIEATPPANIEPTSATSGTSAKPPVQGAPNSNAVSAPPSHQSDAT